MSKTNNNGQNPAEDAGKDTQVSEQPPAQNNDLFDQRELELQERENELNKQEEGLNAFKSELDGRSSALLEREGGLNILGTQLDTRSSELKTKEELLNQREDSLNNLRDELVDKEIKLANSSILKAPIHKSVDFGVESDDILAVNAEGRELSFPKVAWDNLGKDKGGWKRKVSTPKEAQKG